MAGRPIRQIYRQGDVEHAMALWRTHDGCPEAPSRTASIGVLRCQVWDTYANRRELRLCLHDGGHDLRSEWIGVIHRWAFGLAR